MKVAAFAILVAIVVGGLIGTLIVKDQGYVLVSYGGVALETSLWLALVFLGLLYGLLRLILRLIRFLSDGQFMLKDWRSTRKARAARRETIRGLLVMAEGRWTDAKKLLLGQVADSDTPLINYLNAARAAHELKEVDERDELLRLAHETTPGARFAITLTQAQFQMEDGHSEQALASLLTLRERAPKHPAVLAMLAKCYESLEDWPALKDLLPDLTKHAGVSAAELDRLTEVLWLPLLSRELDTNAAWKALPKSERGNARLVRDWVSELIKAGRDDDAEAVVRLGLGQFWDPELVELYGLIKSNEPERQLVTATAWGKERPNDAALSLALGRLCLLNEKFEQARDYFETSLRLAPGPDVYGELGRLCIGLGDEKRGTEYLLRSQGALPDLPQPTEPIIKRASVT